MINSNDKNDENLSKEEYVLNYAKTLSEIDRAMEPYRDHKRALKQSYIDNGWLSKAEMSAILKAYRMLKNEDDVESILNMFNTLKDKVK